MGKRDIFTKILAIIGTILVWFPILMPILISAVVLIGERIFRLDFMMPAELGLFILAGSLYSSGRLCERACAGGLSPGASALPSACWWAAR